MYRAVFTFGETISNPFSRRGMRQEIEKSPNGWKAIRGELSESWSFGGGGGDFPVMERRRGGAAEFFSALLFLLSHVVRFALRVSQ